MVQKCKLREIKFCKIGLLQTLSLTIFVQSLSTQLWDKMDLDFGFNPIMTLQFSIEKTFHSYLVYFVISTQALPLFYLDTIDGHM
jgi:hypothetical protein